MQALEAQPAGTPGEVRVTARRLASAVRITVADNGPGVPPKAREFLFKAFQGSARKGGTGLGLAIAHELIVAHGGTLQLLDVPGGATFEIVIPDPAAD